MGVALPQMSIGRVRTLLIPIPKSEQEQIAIAKQINLLHIAEKQLWQELKKMRCTKTGLMQDLLTGRVRVTPLLEQEPASR